MGETQAMVQVAQIQFSRRGWGRIEPDAVQARRWLEYGASRGDPVAHTSLQNMRTMLAAREHELTVAREYGLVDYNKLGIDGRPIPPSEQAKLAPLNFTRLITHNPTNVLEATSEEEALSLFSKQHYKPLSETLKEHRNKLLSEGKKVPTATTRQPIDYQKLEQDQRAVKNQGLKDISARVQDQLKYRVATGKLTPEEGAKHIQQLQHGEYIMEKKAQQRVAMTPAEQNPNKPQRR
jgi:TPR repeat protein